MPAGEGYDTSFWFTLHDTDGNGLLDGYELMMSLNDGVGEEDRLSFDDVVATTDDLLHEHDLDHEYHHFIISFGFHHI